MAPTIGNPPRLIFEIPSYRILEPESDIEWREQMRGPAFSLATLGLCMSVIYMRGLEIQFSQFFKAWTRTPMERYG